MSCVALLKQFVFRYLFQIDSGQNFGHLFGQYFNRIAAQTPLRSYPASPMHHNGHGGQSHQGNFHHFHQQQNSHILPPPAAMANYLPPPQPQPPPNPDPKSRWYAIYDYQVKFISQSNNPTQVFSSQLESCTAWGVNLFQRFFNESSTVPTRKQGELSEYLSQKVRDKLPPWTVENVTRVKQSSL